MSMSAILGLLLSAQTPGGFTPILPQDCVAETAARQVVDAEDEASCFVGWLYGPGVLESLDPLGADADRVFSRETVAAIAAARARTAEGDQHPAFGADPLCQCQDPGGLIMVISVVSSADDAAAAATVRFTFYPIYDQPIEELTPDQVFENRLLLVKQDDGWRVHDILMPPSGYSFLASLAQ